MILAGVELIMWRTLCFVPHRLKFSYESHSLFPAPSMLRADHQRGDPVYACESGDPTRLATMSGRNGLQCRLEKLELVEFPAMLDRASTAVGRIFSGLPGLGVGPGCTERAGNFRRCWRGRAGVVKKSLA